MLIKIVSFGALPWQVRFMIPKNPPFALDPELVQTNRFPDDFGRVDGPRLRVRVACCDTHRYSCGSIGDYNYFNWCFSLNGDTLPEGLS